MTQASFTDELNADAGRKATEQAEAYENNVFAIRDLVLDDGVTVIKVPPHPSLRLLDDDALQSLDQLDLDLESCERHPDIYIPEQKGKDRTGAEITLPAETKPGALKIPYRKIGDDGKPVLLNPPYEVQVVKIAIGEDQYKKLRAGKIDGHRGSAADVFRFWNNRASDLGRRRETDHKSDGGADVLEAVAAADSERPVEVPSPADS